MLIDLVTDTFLSASKTNLNILFHKFLRIQKNTYRRCVTLIFSLIILFWFITRIGLVALSEMLCLFKTQFPRIGQLTHA